MATKNPTRLGKLIMMPQVDDGSTPAYSNPKTASQIVAGLAATPPTAAIIEAEVFVPNPSRSVFSRESLKSDFYELAPISGDQHGQEFSVRFPVNGWATSVPGTSPTTTSSPSIGIFQSILGSAIAMDPLAAGAGGPGAAGTGSDSDTVNYSTGAYKVGSAVGLENGSFYEAAFIESDAASALELLIANSTEFGNAADSSTIYGSVTCFNSPTALASFSMLWQSYTANSRLLITSAIPTSVTVTFDPRSQLMMEVTFITNTVEQADSGASALDEFNYSLPIIQPPSGGNNSRLVFQNDSSGSAFTDLDCEGFQMTLTQELTPVISNGATTGVRDMVVQSRSQEIAFSTLIGDKNPFDQTPDGKPFVDLSNPSNVGAIQLFVGSQPGKMFGVLIPKPIMTQVPEMADLNGVFAQSFMLKPGDYQNAAAGTGEAKASNFRVAFV
jgi:hypothetical protein